MLLKLLKHFDKIPLSLKILPNLKNTPHKQNRIIKL